jgi:hypothetical protein
MNPKYVPDKDDFDGLLTHVIEECSEVIKAACKLRRFGQEGPDKHRPNVELSDELVDLALSIERFRRLFPIGISELCVINHLAIREQDKVGVAGKSRGHENATEP